ncbi:MAG: type III-B CRISPR module-associated Cmr3 family protein [bacterium]
MLEFKLNPFDVLYFGKTKPFSIGDTVESSYLPTSYTLASAVCSKLYQAFNIETKNIIKYFYGPFIEYNRKLYFPKPHNIYKIKPKYSNNTDKNSCDDPHKSKYFILFPINLEKNFEIFKFVNKNKSQATNDDDFYNLSGSYFLYIGKEDIENFEGFISLQALEKYIQKINKIDFNSINDFQNLDNVLELDQDEILDFKNIFQFDQRIGIKLNDITRNVLQENGLYRVDFLSLKTNSFKSNLSFIFYIEFNESENIKNIDLLTFFENNRFFRLGGEGKFIYYNLKKQNLSNILSYYSKIFKNIDNKENYKQILNKDNIFVIFLNDGYYKDYKELQESINYKFSGFKIESIIFNNLKIVGKYSAKNGNMKVSKKVLPSGTVLFLTKNNSKNSENSNIKNSESLNVMIDFLINKDNLLDSDFIGSNLVLFF